MTQWGLAISVVNKTATVKTKTATSEHNVNITEAQICMFMS